MASSAVIGALRVDLSTNVGQFKSDMDKASGIASRSGRAISTGFRAVATAATAAIGGVTALSAGVVALGVRGSKIAPIEAGFRNLAAAVGQSGDEMLRVAGTATKGLISDLDLMQAANKGLLLGLPLTTESIGDLSAAAVVLGRAMGQDAGKSMDDLITALGRSSPLILDNLGLTVKVGEANERYAAQLGTTASALTDAEKKTAFYEAAMEAARTKVAELGGVQLTFADRLQIVRVGVQNMVDQLASAIATAPRLNEALAIVGETLLAAFGSRQQEGIERTRAIVDNLALGMVNVAATGVDAAGLMKQAWSLLQATFAAVFEAVTKIGQAVTAVNAASARLAASLPIVGRHFTDVARGAEDANVFISGMAESFAEQRQEAMEGVLGNSAFHESLQEMSVRLTDARNRMLAATVATASGTKATQELSDVQDVAVESTKAVTKAVETLTGVISEYQAKLPTTADAIRDLITTQKGLETAVLDSTGGFIGLDGTLNQTVTPTVTGLSGLFRQFKDNSVASLKEFATDGRGIFEGLFRGGGSGGLSSIVSSGLGLLQGALSAALGPAGPLVGIFVQFAGEIGQFFAGIFNGIRSGFNALVSALGFGGTQPAAGRFGIPADHTGFPTHNQPSDEGDVTFAGQSIPQLASGGITTRPVVAQLHANEAVVPLSSGRGGMGFGGVEQRLDRLNRSQEDLNDRLSMLPELMTLAFRSALRSM